jgi:hypothetical protein
MSVNDPKNNQDEPKPETVELEAVPIEPGFSNRGPQSEEFRSYPWEEEASQAHYRVRVIPISRLFVSFVLFVGFLLFIMVFKVFGLLLLVFLLMFSLILKIPFVRVALGNWIVRQSLKQRQRP